MTHYEYVMVMLHWFGCKIYNHPGLADAEYQFIIAALAAMGEE